MAHQVYHTFLESGNASLYTTVCLPENSEKAPTVLFRSPYVDAMENMTDAEIADLMLRQNKSWLDDGYAVVNQHCRGRGRSTGDCIPYIYEREDGLNLQEWVRGRPFYNGEIYLCGGSYTSSVHYVTAPFASDIKGAVLEVQDCERYNCNYRNGFYKMGLHGGWYVGMYKRKSKPDKPFVPESYNLLPLSDFSRAIFGEPAEDFDQILQHPKKDDPFWKTRYGGGEAHDAVKNAQIPILLVTGFYDIYTGGVFDMWNGMEEETRRQCALAVHPYDHSRSAENQPVCFENGELHNAFGNYALRWINFIRGKEPAPFTPGKVTYYRLFDGKWQCDAFETPKNSLEFPIGTGERTYRYNPYAPASFRGGLSTNFGGAQYQDAPNSRYDILSFYTLPFEKDGFVKGKMFARLCVRSSCRDTCFYMRISLETKAGDYGLRDDINAISNFAPEYVPGTEIMMDFSFDEHAFAVKKGQRLRIDISSSAFPLYVRHTNNTGAFAEQTTAQIAENTVICDRSILRVPVE